MISRPTKTARPCAKPNVWLSGASAWKRTGRNPPLSGLFPLERTRRGTPLFPIPGELTRYRRALDDRHGFRVPGVGRFCEVEGSCYDETLRPPDPICGGHAPIAKRSE
jgi:hypothetical protein